MFHIQEIHRHRNPRVDLVEKDLLLTDALAVFLFQLCYFAVFCHLFIFSFYNAFIIFKSGFFCEYTLHVGHVRQF